MDDFEQELAKMDAEELHSQNELSGSVESVIFHNEKNGYVVFRLAVDGGDDLVTVVGTLPYICAGENVWLEGSWTHHASYGEQFKAERAETDVQVNEIAIRVGYDNSSYFSHIFHQCTGLSPNEFRRQNMKKKTR